MIHPIFFATTCSNTDCIYIYSSKNVSAWNKILILPILKQQKKIFRKIISLSVIVAELSRIYEKIGVPPLQT